EPEVDAAPFITFMLDIIEQSLHHYGDSADGASDGVSDGLSGGVNDGVPVGPRDGAPVVRLDALDRTLLAHLTADPTRTITTLAEVTGKSSRTVERRLAKLTAASLLRREGSDKTGVWVVEDNGDGS
ncbi:MAG: AsnC family protein, partial [Micrococcales bacterium]|nr:AsnC family protein [Micrococcales bacterium]